MHCTSVPGRPPRRRLGPTIITESAPRGLLHSPWPATQRVRPMMMAIGRPPTLSRLVITHKSGRALRRCWKQRRVRCPDAGSPLFSASFGQPLAHLAEMWVTTSLSRMGAPWPYEGDAGHPRAHPSATIRPPPQRGADLYPRVKRIATRGKKTAPQTPRPNGAEAPFPRQTTLRPKTQHTQFNTAQLNSVHNPLITPKTVPIFCHMTVQHQVLVDNLKALSYNFPSLGFCGR